MRWRHVIDDGKGTAASAFPYQTSQAFPGDGTPFSSEKACPSSIRAWPGEKRSAPGAQKRNRSPGDARTSKKAFRKILILSLKVLIINSLNFF